MPRPSSIAAFALSLFALASFPGCKTLYSDTYSYKRNHFKPDKETPKPTELLPEARPLDAGAPAAPAPQPPGLDPAAPAPAAPAAPPAIPGL